MRRYEADSLMMSPTCLEPLFSSSDKTLASKVREATRKKNSRTPSPGTKGRGLMRQRGDYTENEKHDVFMFMFMCVWLPPDLADTAQYSALISSDSLMASSSTWDSWSGDWGVKHTDRRERRFRPDILQSRVEDWQRRHVMLIFRFMVLFWVPTRRGLRALMLKKHMLSHTAPPFWFYDQNSKTQNSIHINDWIRHKQQIISF